jgi:hypothetical protein
LALKTPSWRLVTIPDKLKKSEASFPEDHHPVFSEQDLDQFPPLGPSLVHDLPEYAELVRGQLADAAVTLIGAEVNELVEFFCRVFCDFIFKSRHNAPFLGLVYPLRALDPQKAVFLCALFRS